MADDNLAIRSLRFKNGGKGIEVNEAFGAEDFLNAVAEFIPGHGPNTILTVGADGRLVFIELVDIESEFVGDDRGERGPDESNGTAETPAVPSSDAPAVETNAAETPDAAPQSEIAASDIADAYAENPAGDASSRNEQTPIEHASQEDAAASAAGEPVTIVEDAAPKKTSRKKSTAN